MPTLFLLLAWICTRNYLLIMYWFCAKVWEDLNLCLLLTWRYWENWCLICRDPPPSYEDSDRFLCCESHSQPFRAKRSMDIDVQYDDLIILWCNPSKTDFAKIVPSPWTLWWLTCTMNLCFCGADLQRWTSQEEVPFLGRYDGCIVQWTPCCSCHFSRSMRSSTWCFCCFMDLLREASVFLHD